MLNRISKRLRKMSLSKHVLGLYPGTEIQTIGNLKLCGFHFKNIYDLETELGPETHLSRQSHT